MRKVSDVKNLISRAYTFSRSDRGKQVSLLYFSMIINVIIGIVTSIITTRYLGKDNYGLYRYVNNLFLIVTTLTTFGFYLSSKVLIAKSTEINRKREIIGSTLIIYLALTLIYFSIIFVYSFFITGENNNSIGLTIRLFLPLAFVFPMQNLLENILPGDNKILLLSFSRSLPTLLFCSSLLIAIQLSGLNLTLTLFLEFVAMLIVYFPIIFKLKPLFNNIKENLTKLFEKNKSYGINEYFGSLMDVATSQLAPITLLYFTNPESVGFFGLALVASAPLGYSSSVFGAAYFKDFAQLKTIPRKPLLATIVLAIAGLVFYMILMKYVIMFLYGAQFQKTASLIYFVAVAYSLHGIGEFYNRFLGAHSQGKQIRNCAFFVGVTNVLGYVLVVWKFGVYGAAVTRLLADVVFLFSHYFYYKKYIRTAH